MKRIATAALLALLSIAAQAQLALPLQPCTADRPDLAVPAAVRPAGLPQQLGGQCTLGVIEANANGAAAAYWCAHPAPAPATLYLYAVRWSAITPAMLADYAQLGLPGDNAERIRAMQAKYQTANVADMCDVWGPAIARINAAMPAPIAGVWTTPAAGTFTLYTAAGGRLTGIVAGRQATPGAACDCTTPVLSGSSTYCALANAAATEVTLCRKAAP